MTETLPKKTVLDPRELSLGKDQRGVLIGPTGCGKTTLAKVLMTMHNGPLLALDPKRLMVKPGDKERIGINKIVRTMQQVKFEFLKGNNRLVVQPSPNDFLKTQFYDELYQWAYNRGNIMVYTDDLAGVLPQGRQSEWLQRCYSMGREHNVSMLSSIQRPVYYPLYIFSDCNKFFAFRCIMGSDIKRIQEFFPYNPGSLGKYQFDYYDDNSGESRIIKLNLGEKKP